MFQGKKTTLIIALNNFQVSNVIPFVITTKSLNNFDLKTYLNHTVVKRKTEKFMFAGMSMLTIWT